MTGVRAMYASRRPAARFVDPIACAPHTPTLRLIRA